MHKIFIGLVLAITSFSYSQHSVSGTVLDQSTNKPIVGAAIFLQKQETGGITDFEGRFHLIDIPKGKHTLIISSLGYETRTLEIEIPFKEEFTIMLAPTAIEMEEVIISTPFHQLQRDNVMKVERASMEELTRSGSVNLSESISSLAGVETITTGSGIGKPVIRGLSSNRVLVYTQGVRLENQQFGDEHGLGVNASGIESVEVIKGPASLLYGSDALGGVLYLNPENYAPADSTAVDVQTSYFTNTHGVAANAGYKTSGKALKFLVRGNYVTHSDYKTPDRGRVTNTRNKQWDIKSGLGYRTKRYRGDLRYNLTSSLIGIPESFELESTSKEMVEPYQQIHNHVLSLDNSYYLGHSRINLKLGYLFNNRKEFEGDHEGESAEEHAHHADGPALEMHLETLNYDLKYHLPEQGNFETIVGLQGMHQTNTNFGEEFLIPDATIGDIGLMATTHLHLGKMDFQGGFRFDHRQIRSQAMGTAGSADYVHELDRSFNSYNGAIGAKVDFSRQITARLNLATGFRAPNLAELTSMGSHHGANRYEIGNPELTHEQNYQLDLALEYSNEHFELFANGFYNSIQNYIYLTPTGQITDGDAVFQYVQDNADMMGGEAGLHLHPHPIDWLHYKSVYELVVGKQENGNYLPLIPPGSVTNTLQIELPDNATIDYLSVNLKTVFEQDRPGAFETRSHGYSLLGAGVGSAFSFGEAQVDLQLLGSNLLDKTYVAHLSRLKVEGIPNMGRNISIKAKISFH